MIGLLSPLSTLSTFLYLSFAALNVKSGNVEDVLFTCETIYARDGTRSPYETRRKFEVSLTMGEILRTELKGSS